MEKITFVIPSRNNLEFLKISYKSIKNLKNEHQILILDDASSDGTSEWIKSLDDKNLIHYHNIGPERIGIVGMFDKGIELSNTDVILAFHADMVASPNLDTNILKHLKPGTVVSATRIEPPLHPPGAEKITLDWGSEVENFDIVSVYDRFVDIENTNKDKTTEGIFAPWCMYKSDYLAVGGHDSLFAPQSKEDSDLFNRFILNGYKVVQSWDGLVYHFTSRGSRFNKHAGGAAGKNSEEWLYTTTKNAKNFIRKWGHFVKHDEFMKPIIPHKYGVGLVVKNCNLELLRALEPWCDKIYIEDGYGMITTNYIDEEQKNTKFDLSKRIRLINHHDPICENDIVVEFDGTMLNQNNFIFIERLSEILTENEISVGYYEMDIFKFHISSVRHYENDLIKIVNNYA